MARQAETSIGANNQPDLTISTGVAQAPKALKLPTMEEVIVITTAFSVGVNRNPRIVIRTGVDGSTPFTSETRAVDGESGTGAIYPSPPTTTPPSVIWNIIIRNI